MKYKLKEKKDKSLTGKIAMQETSDVRSGEKRYKDFHKG